MLLDRMICGENRESASSLVYGQSRGDFSDSLGATTFRGRSTADAQRANCAAPERTGADRRRQPCKSTPSLASTPIQFCAGRGRRILDLEDVMYQ